MANTTCGNLSLSDVNEVKAQLESFYLALRMADESTLQKHFHHFDRCFSSKSSIAKDDSVFIGTSPSELIQTHVEINNYWPALFGGLGSLPDASEPPLPLYLGGGLPIVAGAAGPLVSGRSFDTGKVAWLMDQPTVELRGLVHPDLGALIPYNSRTLSCRFTAVLQYPALDPAGAEYWMFTQAHLSLGVSDAYLPFGIVPQGPLCTCP